MPVCQGWAKKFSEGLRLRWKLVTIALSLAMTTPAQADFSACKGQLIEDAERSGISRETASRALSDLIADPKVLDLESYQPEFKTPVWDYLAALVDDERVSDGKAAMAQHAKALTEAERRFGVSKFVLAAIWGVESNFGSDMGERPLLQSLTSLACLESRRPKYFRGELMAALRIVDRGDIPLDKLKGSWAGAFGQTQFMPSTFLKLAVNLDGSGRDIIDNAAAALGSTANYLRNSGWIKDEPWIFEVQVPDSYEGPSGRKLRRPMSFWAKNQLTRIDGEPLAGGQAALFFPAGRSGPAFLVTKNFDAIYSYNASESYALAIAILAQRLAGGPGITRAWPTDDPGISRAERREVQELLTKRGYDVGAADGAIGAKTNAAIKDFQAKVGLATSGRASKKVLDKLRE